MRPGIIVQRPIIEAQVRGYLSPFDVEPTLPGAASLAQPPRVLSVTVPERDGNTQRQRNVIVRWFEQ